MANTPQFSTTLQESNYSPDVIVNKLAGAEGPSPLEAVGRVAKAGLEGYDAYRTYKIKGIKEEIGKEVGSLINEAQLGSPSRRAEVMEEQASSQYLLNAIPENEQTSEYRIPLLSKMQESLDFLSKAEKQRRMSPRELQTRGLSIVKNALANNPGYRKEILTAVANTFEDEGIMERIKYDDSLVKNEVELDQAQQKDMRKLLDEKKLPLIPFQDATGRIDIMTAQRAVDKQNEEVRKYETAERALKSGDIANKQQVQNLISTNEHTNISNGLVKTAWIKANDMLNSGLPYAKLVPDLEFEMDRFITDANNRFGTFSFDPTIKQTLDSTLDRIKNIKQTIKDAGSLENAKTYSTNANILNTIIETNQLRDTVGNIQSFEQLLKLASNPFMAKLLSQGMTDTAKKLITSLSDMANGLRVNNSHLQSSNGIPSVASIYFDTATAAIKGGNTVGVKAFNTTTSDRVIAINSLEDPDQRFSKSEDFIKQLANPNNLDGIKALDVETKTASANLVLEHSKSLTAALKKLTDKEGVSFSFTADGLLNLNGVTRQENADIVSRINTNLSAYANLKGSSTKLVSNEFFSSVYNNVFSPKDVPSGQVENRQKATNLISTLTRIESGNRQTDLITGKIITSPKGAQGITQVMPATGRRPGFGIPPLDYTKKGADLQKEYIRFAEDYLTESLNIFNGDERKAMASYNAGIPAVQNAIAKATKNNKPGEWLSYLPEETRNYVKKANLPSDAKDLTSMVATLRKNQLAIKDANPDIYKSLYKDSSVEMAKDIVVDLQEKGITASYEEVFQILEKTNTLDRTPSASQSKEAEIYNSAKLILDTPDLYNRYSPEEQEAIGRLVDKPLEGVYPEELLMVGGLVKRVASKALSAFANRNMPGYAKVLEKASERAKTTTLKPAATSPKYEAKPIKELMEEAKKGYSQEEKLRSSTARAAEKVARDSKKPVEEGSKSVAENAARLRAAKARATRAANKAKKLAEKGNNG